MALALAVALAWAAECAADATSDAFFSAEACYNRLQKNPRDMRMRHQWMRCIRNFEGVYRRDTDGPWAPASLYMTGVLWGQLARHSGSRSDREQADQLLRQVIDRFPTSRYSERAAAALAKTGETAARPSSRGETPPPQPVADAPAPKERYMQAEACYRGLRQNPSRQKYRHNWMRCIDGFHKVYASDPEGGWAAAGLFMEGKLYRELYSWSKNPDDALAARTAYETVIAKYPQSRYRRKAQDQIDADPELRRSVAVEPAPDAVGEVIASAEEPAGDLFSAPVEPGGPSSRPGQPVTIENLRYWSNPNYTRVVIDASAETGFTHHLLKKDPALDKPQRLYVDLESSRLGQNIQRSIPINDDLLSDARAGQYTSESVRVVVDIKSFETYKIFSLKDPFRIVIDVWGATDGRRAAETPPSRQPSDAGRLPAGALAKQLALGVSRIVVDPGHGGRDYGAPGYLKGVHEKHVVLQIAKRLAKALREEIGCEVVLTRTSDRYLTLEERTAFANTQNADLFISLHTNAHSDRRAGGIETYFLNLATDDDAIRVAAMENATSTKNISDLQTILNDLMQNAKINESSRLAGYVHTSVIGQLKRSGYSRVTDKGVKQAPFYVLLGAQMPAVLLETAFISNPVECKRLVDPNYQERYVQAVVLGIKKYIRDTQPKSAFRQPSALDPRTNAVAGVPRGNS